MIFKTANLTLRPWEESDAECLYHFAKNPKIGPIAGWPPHESVEDAEEYWGNGYATEASKAIINHAFSDLNVNEIYASYKYENKQSGRVLEKLGFKYLTELNNMNYLGEAFIEIAMKLEK